MSENLTFENIFKKIENIYIYIGERERERG